MPASNIFQSFAQGQQMANQRELQEQQRQQNFLNLNEQRKGALFQDARVINSFLKSGQPQQAMGIIRERLSLLDGEGDPSDTLEIAGLISSGNMQGATDLLDGVELAGVQSGFLQDLTPKQQKREAFQKGDGGLVFDPNSGSFFVDEVATARFNELANKKAQTGGIGLKDKQSINKDVTGFIKNSVSIRNTANDLDKLSKLGTGPAAIAAVFKFMKANDPTSTVREGEFATAEQSTGIPSQVTNFYNKLVTGERLTENQIQQFVETSKVLANSAINSAATEVDKFLNTFGEDLPVKFQRSVRKRTPEPFEIAPQTTAPTGQAQSFTSPSGIQFTVGG
jgi:hypothetical protein